MNLLVRSIVSGFGMALGAALFKKVQPYLGLADDEPGAKDQAPAPVDPGEPGDGEPLAAPAT